jgi:hypothetical protein
MTETTRGLTLNRIQSFQDVEVAVEEIHEKLLAILSIRGTFAHHYVAALTEPVPANNEIILWYDRTNSLYYLVASFAGTVKKVKLT